MGDGGNILNATNLHSSTSEGTESSLSTGSGVLGAGSSHSADLDVKGGDAELLAANSDVLGGKHSGVGARLVTISLDLHSTSDTAQSFATRKISDVL